MELFLPYLYENVSILFHPKPNKSVLQCLVESVTRITQV